MSKQIHITKNNNWGYIEYETQWFYWNLTIQKLYPQIGRLIEYEY